MDKKSFKLLKHLDSIENPTLENCHLSKFQENYDYLKIAGYLEHISGRLDVRVTRSGKEALEKYEMQQQLLVLQKQNTEIQDSLRIVQWITALVGVANLLLTLLLRPPV